MGDGRTHGCCWPSMPMHAGPIYTWGTCLLGDAAAQMVPLLHVLHDLL